MKNRLTLSCAMALVSVPVFADNTDSTVVGISGQVVAALNISLDTPVTMPDLVASDGTSTTGVRLSCFDSGTSGLGYTGGGSPFTNGSSSSNVGVATGSVNKDLAVANSTGTCGKITVTGETDYSYSMKLSPLVGSGTVSGLSLTNADCNNGGGLALLSHGNTITTTLASGTDTLHCGATVQSTGASAGTGAYNDLSYTVTVVYD